MNFPNFSFEKRLWKKGFKFVAGCDEVGRGCFAGPVIAACVVFPNNLTMEQLSNEAIEINDSKKLSSRKRNLADKWIRGNMLAFGIGEGKVAEINRLGMSKATLSAFRRAVAAANKTLEGRIDYLLVDAFYVPFLRSLPTGKKDGLKLRKRPKVKNGRARQLAIIDGDEKSFSISSASIIAKVYRDKLMTSLSEKSKYKKYGWDKNKGYGTREHLEAIKNYGITKHHRKKFVETYFSKTNS